MTFTITLEGLVQFFLIVLGFIIVGLLISILVMVRKTVKSVSGLLEDNKKEIDGVIKDAPVLVSNVKDITTNAKDILNENRTDIKQIVEKAKDTADKASSIAQDLGDTVYYISETAVDTASSFRENLNTTSDIVSRLLDLIEIFKGYSKKKRR